MKAVSINCESDADSGTRSDFGSYFINFGEVKQVLKVLFLILNYKNRCMWEQECIKCLISIMHMHLTMICFQHIPIRNGNAYTGLTQKKGCVHKTAVCTVFIQPREFKLGTLRLLTNIHGVNTTFCLSTLCGQ